MIYSNSALLMIRFEANEKRPKCFDKRHKYLQQQQKNAHLMLAGKRLFFSIICSFTAHSHYFIIREKCYLGVFNGHHNHAGQFFLLKRRGNLIS